MGILRSHRGKVRPELRDARQVGIDRLAEMVPAGGLHDGVHADGPIDAQRQLRWMPHGHVCADVQIRRAVDAAPNRLGTRPAQLGSAMAALRSRDENDLMDAGLDVENRAVDHGLHEVAAVGRHGRLGACIAERFTDGSRGILVWPVASNDPNRARLRHQARAAGIRRRCPARVDHQFNGLFPFIEPLGSLADLSDSHKHRRFHRHPQLQTKVDANDSLGCNSTRRKLEKREASGES